MTNQLVGNATLLGHGPIPVIAQEKGRSVKLVNAAQSLVEKHSLWRGREIVELKRS